MSERHGFQSSKYASTARVDDERARDFIVRINGGLESTPHYVVDNPFVAVDLLDEYFSAVDGEDEFQHRLGRAAARYLQKLRAPMADRIPKPSTDNDVIEAVARTVARSINERRRISAQQRAESA